MVFGFLGGIWLNDDYLSFLLKEELLAIFEMDRETFGSVVTTADITENCFWFECGIIVLIIEVIHGL